MHELTSKPTIVGKGILGYDLGWLASSAPFASPVYDMDGVRYNLHPCERAEGFLREGRAKALDVPEFCYVAGIRWTEPVPVVMNLIPYWVRFNDGTDPVCVEAHSESAARLQADPGIHGTIRDIRVLPYPAHPRVSEVRGDCPTFCHAPDKCAGHTSCPGNYACND